MRYHIPQKTNPTVASRESGAWGVTRHKREKVTGSSRSNASLGPVEQINHQNRQNNTDFTHVLSGCVARMSQYLLREWSSQVSHVFTRSQTGFFCYTANDAYPCRSIEKKLCFVYSFGGRVKIGLGPNVGVRGCRHMSTETCATVRLAEGAIRCVASCMWASD